MVGSSTEVTDKFNTLLEQCYKGNLREFCSEFDVKNRGESFYKRVQKARHRMRNQSISQETIDEFKKYIVFMEFKLLEQESSWDEKKLLWSLRASSNFLIKRFFYND
ncbi:MULTISPECIES: hypothetical protein [Acinetobacter]|uniref:hypothetical protein n=1 Tax=Acinetobacter TaxID=469 RepID=UPI001F2993C8|nr:MULTISPECIES: hypothetical protein [Acinetobacter]MDV2455006.1 hypothetical protein [Acinetobacter towneri]UIZ57489.1 hypothetical protein LZP46_14275 [Acinetobacter sp. SCLZS86]WOE28928.1 hypothetical protein QSG83_01570 [Acinetobacter towneri]